MIHEDEKQLFKELLCWYIPSTSRFTKDGYNFLFPTDIGLEIGIPEKRTYYILHKWSRRGIWGSGVTERSGWFELPPRYPIREDCIGWFAELTN
jgi:hypothetical protein